MSTLNITPKQSQILFDAFNKFRTASVAANEAFAQLEIAKALVADSLNIDPAKLVSINEKANTVEVEADPSPQSVDTPT